MARVREQLDHRQCFGSWKTVLMKCWRSGLDPNAALSRRSPAAGCVKRALGRALVSNPRVLLLDEPTNHLDIRKLSTGWKGF